MTPFRSKNSKVETPKALCSKAFGVSLKSDIGEINKNTVIFPKNIVKDVQKLRQISYDLAEYVRKNARLPVSLKRTVHNYYIEENRESRRLIAEYERKNYKKGR